MANLPPRPESPLRLPPRDDRRHIVDERERDRRSAQPMAPRYRSGRSPERDRAYIPRPRLDTYVAPPYEGRRDDRRDYDDRDRDRSRRDFDRDRDRRNWDRERERDRDRSPPRRWSPDRDRRPYDRDRGPPRRPPSPPRRFGPRRDSRSPPPARRRYSRSPSYRGRNRTRSRSRGPYRSPPPHRSPPPQRGIRLGNHSIAASPRSRSSRSPRRRRYSRDRSPLSPSRRPNRRTQSPPRDEQKPLPTEPSADRHKEEPMNTTLHALPTSPVKIEEPSSLSVPPLPQTPIVDQTKQAPVGQDSTQGPEEIKSESKPESLPVIPLALPKPEPDASQQPIAPPTITATPESADVKMDVDSPKPPTLTSTQSRGSTPPKPSPAGDQNRGPPTGPRWVPTRSPPRGPRSHLHPRPPPPPQSSSSYQSAPRGPRRDYRPAYQTSTPKFGPPVPAIPPYRRPPPSDLEAEIARLQTQKANLGVEHYQHINSARRALQELDMASIDMQAAENRRRIADLQLEKAKTGSLGIDAPLTDFGGI